jgi:MutS domain V
MEKTSPSIFYQEQLEKFSTNANELENQDTLIASTRGLVFLSAIGVAFGIWRYQALSVEWIWVPIAIFAVLMFIHGKVLRKKKLAQDACLYYRTGINRLQNSWHGIGDSGERFLDANHPYTSDLDIFGKGSLFQFMNFSQTSLGEDCLAQWLSEVPDAEGIKKRQNAVKELAGETKLFEEYALLYPELKKDFNQSYLEQWSQKPAFPIPASIRWIATGLGFSMFGSVLCLLGMEISPLVGLLSLITVLSVIVLTFLYRNQIRVLAADADKAGSGLDVLSSVMELIEKKQFQSELFQEIKNRLETEGVEPSKRITQLHNRIQNLNNSTQNQFFAPISFALCLPIHFIHSLEVWRSKVGVHLPEWLSAVGEFEALLSLARYTYEHPEDIFPKISSTGSRFEAENLGHPLVDNSICVRNNVTLNEQTKLIMISGSNMSGKSTMLRTIGTNAVLSFAGAPVRASGLQISPFIIGTAMRIQDSLQDGKSLFYAVLSRLKSVIELAGNQPPLLFLLDEILHGTNSHDRRVGAEGIIKGLIEKNAIGLVTTHDLELTKIVDQVENHAINIHFQDQIENGEMTFDYKIHPGVVEKSNALELMKIVGLEF